MKLFCLLPIVAACWGCGSSGLSRTVPDNFKGISPGASREALERAGYQCSPESVTAGAPESRTSSFCAKSDTFLGQPSSVSVQTVNGRAKELNISFHDAAVDLPKALAQTFGRPETKEVVGFLGNPETVDVWRTPNGAAWIYRHMHPDQVALYGRQEADVGLREASAPPIDSKDL